MEASDQGTFSRQMLFLALAAALIISAVNFVNPVISIGLALTLAMILFLDQKPVYSIVFLVLITPFSTTSLLDTTIAGIPGMKPANLLAIAAVGFLMLGKKPARLNGDDKAFIFGVLILFTVAVLRSVSYIGETYSMIWSDEYSTMKYLLSNLVKPLLIFLLFILISVFVRSRDDINKILIGMMLSIVLLSIFLLLIYAFFTPNKLNFEMVRQGFAKALGMHSNNLADFYIAVYPVLFAYAVSRKSLFWMTGVILSLAAVGIIYSRSAYLVIVLCTFAFFLLSNRARLLPWVGAAGLASLLLIPQTIIERALTGLANSDVTAISAGRVDQIWIPLIREFAADPMKLVIGAGRYAVMGTVAFKNGLILQVGHAHSMYLDTMLDAGLIGLVFFLISFFHFMRKFISTHKQIKDQLFMDIMIGIEISIAAFLIRGVTDSFFFPALTNAFLWINLGLGTSIVYLYQSERRADEDENSGINQQPAVWRR